MKFEWMSFPEIGPSHQPENWVFKDLPTRVKRYVTYLKSHYQFHNSMNKKLEYKKIIQAFHGRCPTHLLSKSKRKMSKSF